MKPTIAIPPEGCETYLTAGKEYKILRRYDDGVFEIRADDGGKRLCSAINSAHLNFKDWILK